MEIYYFTLIILAASILQAITGFGGALIAAPLLLLFIDKTTSVISLAFVSIAINTILLISIRNPIDKKTFYNLFVPSLVGLPIGIYILNNLDIATLRILVGILSIIFAILLFSKKFRVKSSRIKQVCAGLFSGILRTSIGLNSPPVVLLLASENTDKDEMRKTLAFLFLMMSLVSVILFFFTDHFTEETWKYSLLSIPAAIVGGWIGDTISKKVSQKGFIWSVFILITASIVVAIYSGFKN
ncbi:MAG: sulfite exporter TauE/SafE family protein [Patescibacteria group bacterium]